MLEKLETIKTVVKDPKFQRNVALAGGKVAGTILSMVAAGLINRGIEAGINAVFDKIQTPTDTTITNVE